MYVELASVCVGGLLKISKTCNDVFAFTLGDDGSPLKLV